MNYKQICQDLIKGLAPKQKEIILRRFALAGSAERETLESIGKTWGVTRERVRQIEDSALKTMKEDGTGKCKEIFQSFRKYFQAAGGLKKEDLALKELGQEQWQNQVYFLLTLDGGFLRFGENKDIWSCWGVSLDYLKEAKKVIGSLSQKFQELEKPLKLKELAEFASLKPQVLDSYLAISKKIQKNPENLFGLKYWPEINPRGVRDKAVLVLKKEQKPLHFLEIAGLIEGSLVQTVHNELIRDPRFVLIGRGIYALKDWGYEPGQVKDVILKTLKEEGRPLARQEILERVLRQRLVKENTIFLNLANKNYFSRDIQGKYWVREA